MKWLIIALAIFTLAALAGWPYLYVYRLDRAVTENDRTALERLVDLDAVRDNVKAELAERVSGAIGARKGSFLGWIRHGVTQIGNRAVDISIDMDWVYDTLRTRGSTTDPDRDGASLLAATRYAFFESYDRFLVRVERGGAEPLRIRMELHDGRWRVTAIYD